MATDTSHADGEAAVPAPTSPNAQECGEGSRSFVARGEPLPKVGRLHNSDSNAESPWARKVILCLDGGGVRGFASLHILDAIIERAKKLEQPGRPASDKPRVECSAAYPWSNGVEDIIQGRRDRFLPHHYIDYFAGTSTGGLSAIMLGRLQMTVPEALSRYDRVGNGVFAKPRKTTLRGVWNPLYRSKYMDRALQHSTQQDVLQRVCHESLINAAGVSNSHESIQRRADRVMMRNENQAAAQTLVTSFAGKGSQETYVFRSYDNTRAPDTQTSIQNPGPASDWPLWKVGRATSAAPTFFSGLQDGDMEFLDGAVGGQNNPSNLAYTEVRHMHWVREPLMVISIGTGMRGPQSGQGQIRGFLKHFRGLPYRAKVFINQVLDSQRQHEDFERRIQQINAHLPEQDRVQLFRFNVPTESDLPGRVGLGDWKGKNGVDTKEKLTSAVYQYMLGESDRLTACAESLVKLRRDRAETERWEQFALHLIYTCQEENCMSPAFPSRGELREHAVQVHGFVWQVPCVRSDGTVVSDWACYRDQCGRNRVSCFQTRREFEDHSAQIHRIPHPRILSIGEFNRWLDRCRSPREVPLPRHSPSVGQHAQNS